MKGFGMKSPALESGAIHGCEFNTADFLKEYCPKECQKDHLLMYAVEYVPLTSSF